MNEQTITIDEKELMEAVRCLRTTIYAARDLAYEVASANNKLSEDMIGVINDFFDTKDYHQLDLTEWLRSYYADTIETGADVDIIECQQLLSENLMVEVADVLKSERTLESKQSKWEIADKVTLTAHDLSFFIAHYFMNEISRPDTVNIERLNEAVRERLVDDDSMDIPLDVIVSARDYCKFEYELQVEERLIFAASGIVDALTTFNITKDEFQQVTLEAYNKFFK